MSRNGYLPAAALTEVEPGLLLEVHTAFAFIRARAAAARDSVRLTIARPAGAYRTWATQLDMRAHPGKYNIGTGFGLPGLPSDHGFGTCVDIAEGLAWMIQHAAEHGFSRPLARTDPNHFRFGGTLPAAYAQSVTPNRKRKKMNFVLAQAPGRGAFMIRASDGAVRSILAVEVEAQKAAGIEIANVSAEAIDLQIKLFGYQKEQG